MGETHPVFCCLANESILTTSSTRVTFDRVTTSTNKVIQLGKFDDESIPVVSIKRSFFEVELNESRLERDCCLFLNANITIADRSRIGSRTSCFYTIDGQKLTPNDVSLRTLTFRIFMKPVIFNFV
jgi:hypothetical protein